MNPEINIYIMCSTLNQMVNYLPLKSLSAGNAKIGNQRVNIDRLYYITIEDESEKSSIFKRFPNEKWDKSFNDVVKKDNKLANIKIKGISITRKESCVPHQVAEKIRKFLAKEKISDNSIIWNITGGQRNILMGIYKIIEERKQKNKFNDKIIYLEGNSNRAIILGENSPRSPKYYYKNLTIETALELAGFDIGKNKRHVNLLDKNNQKYRKKYSAYLELQKIYIRDKELREKFMSLNKEKIDISWEDIREYLKVRYPEYNVYLEQINKAIGEDYNKKTLFGYILENMSVAVMIDKIESNDKLKDYFVDMAHSGKIYFADSSVYREQSSSMLFEFDIVLLSKSGQMVIFECKSGAMSGETAKSRRYSVYAAAGVYGKPIIITPLIEDEVYEIDEICGKIKGNKEKELIYETIRSAIHSAKRAEMDVWSIDQIAVKLEDLFAEALD